MRLPTWDQRPPVPAPAGERIPSRAREFGVAIAPYRRTACLRSQLAVSSGSSAAQHPAGAVSSVRARPDAKAFALGGAGAELLEGQRGEEEKSVVIVIGTR